MPNIFDTSVEAITHFTAGVGALAASAMELWEGTLRALGLSDMLNPLALFLLLIALTLMSLMLLRPPRRHGESELPDLRMMTAGTRRVALVTAWLLFGVGGFWAVAAPLTSAAIARGVVSPEGARRSVQHLEGGIIRAIHVADGDKVEAGAPLVTLEDVRARADNLVLKERLLQSRAEVARLTAEQAVADIIVLPPALTRTELSPSRKAVVQSQVDLFEGRRATLQARRSVLERRVRQLDEENAGLREAIAGQDEQLMFIGQELANVQTLFDKGLARMPRLLDLKRQRAQIRIERAQNRAAIARNAQKIGETEIEKAKLVEEWRERAASELAEARAELAEVLGRLPETEDALRRTVITSPVGGTVVELAFTTIGGVVRPGDEILDIVPSDGLLYVDARVRPIDIDVVRGGLPAQIVFSAYAQRNMPRIDGTVRSVSADRITDERSGDAYYLAKVAVPRERLAALDVPIELVPGMPAEVMIRTGSQTFYDYLVSPILESFNRSFREQ